MSGESKENQLTDMEQAIRLSQETARSEQYCRESESGGGGHTPSQNEDAYDKHIANPEKWFELKELKNLVWEDGNTPSNAFGVEAGELKSDKLKKVSEYFLSRVVPGDGFCLIRSIEALIDKRYKYLENPRDTTPPGMTREVQTEKFLDKIGGTEEVKKILKKMDFSDLNQWFNDLNLKNNAPNRGNFCTLGEGWLYIMSHLEDKRIVVFVHNDTAAQKHYIIYPKQARKETYNSVDKTLFIYNNTGHYYPLELKGDIKNNEGKLNGLIKDVADKFPNEALFSLPEENYKLTPATSASPTIPTNSENGGDGESNDESPTDPAEAAMRILEKGKRKREAKEAEAAKKKKAEEAVAAKKKKAEDAKAEKEAKAAKAAADKAEKAARKAETAAEEAEKKLKEADKELVVSFLTDLKHFVPEKKNDDEANSSFKVSDKRVVIYKKTFEDTKDYNDLKDNIDENLKEEHKYVFKKGFIDNIREYYVIDDNYGKKESEVKPGQLLYRNVFGLDDGLKYRDSNGEEKEFIKYEKLKKPEDPKILNHIIKLDMKNRFKVNNNNEKYYNLRKKYLRSEHFLKLEQFKESEKFDDQVAFKMEKVTYMLKQNIFYKDNNFVIVPFSFSPDKHSLDDINENINKDKIEKENEKKDKREKKEKYEDIELTGKKYGSGIMGATSMTIGSLMLGGVIAGGSAIAIGTLTGGIPFAIGAGVYAVKKTKEHRKKTESNYPYNLSTRFKRQLHRIVHIISFAMELKKKYTKEEHLIEEWKNTMINIQLRRIYDKFGFDNKLNNEAEKMLKNEFKAKMKIVKENKKSWFHKKNKA